MTLSQQGSPDVVSVEAEEVLYLFHGLMLPWILTDLRRDFGCDAPPRAVRKLGYWGSEDGLGVNLARDAGMDGEA